MQQEEVEALCIEDIRLAIDVDYEVYFTAANRRYFYYY